MAGKQWPTAEEYANELAMQTFRGPHYTPKTLGETLRDPIGELSPAEIKKAEAARRKGLPLFTGVMAYFPDALLAVAEVSRIGNDQHNPGQPLHWAREKSTDQMDAAARHMVDSLKDRRDTDGGRHLAKAIWRLAAELQLQIEEERGKA